MGRGMAKNLIEKGNQVTDQNITIKAIEKYCRGRLAQMVKVNACQENSLKGHEVET